MPLPERLAIQPCGPLHATVRVPGSKSISNRALLIAGLAKGSSVLEGVLDCDDTRVMARALQAMGARIEIEEDVWTLTGLDGRPRVPDDVIDVHASGTAARFLTAVAAALVPGTVRLDGTERMRQRPIGALVDALRQLGADVAAEGPGGCPPVEARGGHWDGGRAMLDARQSSQYVSAVLQVAPYAARDVVLELRKGELVSRPYVELTLQCMRDFGAQASWGDADSLWVRAGRHYTGRRYVVEPDASTAAYFFVAAAVTGGRVRVAGLPGSSRQADMGLLAVLERMGCRVERGVDFVELQASNEPLQAVDVDMNAMPDAVLAMAVAAAFAEGETTLRNIGNLRLKETDRLTALENELGKLGCDARAGEDWLHIRPGRMRGAEIETYDDHRMAMAFALAGLRVPGVVIRDPSCVSKSWPGYFDALQRVTR